MSNSKPLIDPTLSVNDKIAKLIKISERLARRSVKKAVAIITPFPISNAVFGESVSGSILRYMFPCDGVITKGLIKFGSLPKSPISVGITVSNVAYANSKAYMIDRQQYVIEPNLAVKTGDCLDIQVNSAEGNTITEVWISFLWVPSVKDVTAKSYLIEELENDLLEEGN